MDRLQSMKIFACVVESGGFTAVPSSSGCRRPRSPVMLRRWSPSSRPASARTHHPAHAPDRNRRNHLERCRRILALVEEADAIGEAHRGEPRGVLRLTAAASFARVHLAPAIAEYMQQYPRNGLRLILSDRTLNMVDDEGIDLAFRITQAVDPGLVARRLAPCRVVVCAAPAYLARRGKP